jgi:hypothetical protein
LKTLPILQNQIDALLEFQVSTENRQPPQKILFFDKKFFGQKLHQIHIQHSRKSLNDIYIVIFMKFAANALPLDYANSFKYLVRILVGPQIQKYFKIFVYM